MAFTIAELENIASAAIDFHFKRGTVVSSTKFNKPTLEKLEKMTIYQLSRSEFDIGRTLAIHISQQ